MTVKGKVVSVEKDRACVEVRRRAMCDGCPNDSQDSCGHTCAMSSLLGERKNMTVTVKNTLGAQVGDTVGLDCPDRTVLSSAFLVFIFPLILAFLFYFVSDRLFSNETVSLICAGAGFVLSFLICAFIERRVRSSGSKITMVPPAR